jgi:hypothetical protein
VISAMLVMVVVDLLLFWAPVVGPIMAGALGGWIAGSAGTAFVAAILPAILVGILLFLALTYLSLPIVGGLLGLGEGREVAESVVPRGRTPGTGTARRSPASERTADGKPGGARCRAARTARASPWREGHHSAMDARNYGAFLSESRRPGDPPGPGPPGPRPRRSPQVEIPLDTTFAAFLD